ncbi:hypothetical protein MGN70_000406 [Eutypa lata]|nr:hypothetical protein MGN70_000406 [Eutypa lata]
MDPWGFYGGNAGGGNRNPWGRGNDEDYNMLRVQPAQAARSANDATSVVDRARNLFDDNPRFEFEGLLASTHNGTTMRFKEVGEGGRRFVAKAGTSGTEDAVNNEISYLNILQYAMHVVKPLAIDPNPLVNLGVPYYITEYLQNGTLKLFVQRTRQAGERLPNRLLWRLFLCMVRAGVEIAWPPNNPVQLGQIGTGPPSKLAHNDFHNENLMFGSLDNNTPEHALVPILQLIGFGKSGDMDVSPALNAFQLANYDRQLNLDQYRRPADKRTHGTDKNIYDVGVLMALIIRQRDSASPADIRTWIRDPNLLPRVEGISDLDSDLRLLVQRCIAENPLNRPRLEELLVTVSDAVVTKTAQAYPNNEGFESDDHIEYLVKKYIIDADVEPPVAGAGGAGGGGGGGGGNPPPPPPPLML